MKIRKGDTIKIISGNDKGKQAKVLAVFPKEGRIVAEGIYIKKKHVRPKRQGQKGELVRIPGLFPVSRAMIVCPKCGKPARIGFQKNGTQKIRVCKKCGREL
ncbi:MAG: large subunit ribosomal protein L24 [Parcubacteria group bacterium Gr01-1014_33]|nr:MAG: large subunit ribosomal protein L24 [Parcubacteria group bacterium Gr01-1014_33]